MNGIARRGRHPPCHRESELNQINHHVVAIRDTGRLEEALLLEDVEVEHLRERADETLVVERIELREG